jgi:hypothetical protein
VINLSERFAAGECDECAEDKRILPQFQASSQSLENSNN